MSKIVLKTAKRTTSVSRLAVRNAVSGAFVNAPSKNNRNGRPAKKAAAKKQQ